MRQAAFPYMPKDFIETAEGLIFAVVSYQAQDGKVGCFLRYVRKGNGWRKVATDEANALLQKNYPQYLYHSQQFDADFHAILPEEIVVHHKPEVRLQTLLHTAPHDELEQKLHQLIAVLVQGDNNCDFLGLTGSMLLGQQTAMSDIDLVVYGREAFHQVRADVQQAVAEGLLSLLDDALMLDNFERRSGALELEDFSWHENRKFNKAVIQGSKFDIGMVCLEDIVESELRQYEKLGNKTVRAKVIDDALAFDFPAKYVIDNDLISEVVVYTHTYVGQAQLGEKIEVSGSVEREMATGECRLIVGSSREAAGEYIKVCR
jgi:predicted nucleotidyltransferase